MAVLLVVVGAGWGLELQLGLVGAGGWGWRRVIVLVGCLSHPNRVRHSSRENPPRSGEAPGTTAT